jgi:hypothetical protein
MRWEAKPPKKKWAETKKTAAAKNGFFCFTARQLRVQLGLFVSVERNGFWRLAREGKKKFSKGLPVGFRV